MPRHQSFEARLEELLDDPSTTHRLLTLISIALDGDPLDALGDAEVLLDLLRGRFDELTPDGSEEGRAANVIHLSARLKALRDA